MSSTTATGERNLPSLIASMQPTLTSPETHVFAHIPLTSPLLPTLLSPETSSSSSPSSIKMLFREREAWTLILPQSRAEQLGLEYSFPCRQITLNVHSSLDAVGFLAAVTRRLAEGLGIGVNPVSGFYHDHLFVPLGREGAAVAELEAMARECREEGLKV